MWRRPANDITGLVLAGTSVAATRLDAPPQGEGGPPALNHFRSIDEQVNAKLPTPMVRHGEREQQLHSPTSCA